MEIILYIKQEKNYFQITEGKVQIHYVEGTHITIMNNDKIISAINGKWIEE